MNSVAPLRLVKNTHDRRRGSDVAAPEDRPRDRLAAALRAHYPHGNAAKLLARDIGVTPRAAANLLAGHWPDDQKLLAIVRAFGRDVLETLFGADIDAAAARLAEDIRTQEAAIEAKKATLRRLGGVSARLGDGANDGGRP